MVEVLKIAALILVTTAAASALLAKLFVLLGESRSK
jgi:hypothetical protein